MVEPPSTVEKYSSSTEGKLLRVPEMIILRIGG
jgi:hypothetical protein